MSLAKQIWTWYEERNILLLASYIASIDNSIADRESRAVSPDTEWSLSQFEPFDIDLFASIINTKCTSYVSWFPDPGSVAVDAFTLSWGDINFFVFPPFILLQRVLRKIVNDKARGVVVVHRNPGSLYFVTF